MNRNLITDLAMNIVMIIISKMDTQDTIMERDMDLERDLLMPNLLLMLNLSMVMSMNLIMNSHTIRAMITAFKMDTLDTTMVKDMDSERDLLMPLPNLSL